MGRGCASPGRLGGGKGDAGHEAAILDACEACLRDSSLDTPTKLSKIKKLLGMIDDPDDDEDTDAEGADYDGEEGADSGLMSPDTQEGRRRRKLVGQLREQRTPPSKRSVQETIAFLRNTR